VVGGNGRAVGYSDHPRRGHHRLVITINAWAGELFPLLRSFISPTRGHVIWAVDFQLTPWVANAGWDYGRQLEDGRLLIGGQRVSRPDREKGHAPPSGENVPPIEPEVVEALIRITPKLFPALTQVPIVHHWTGAMAFTPDEQPLVGRWPGQADLWLMAGFSGHGMPFSQVLPYTVAAQRGRDGPPSRRFAPRGSWPAVRIRE
jgi:glycine/D-amino acid oxidase-like deaminating enzyme